MRSVLVSKWQRLLLQNAVSSRKSQRFFVFLLLDRAPPELQELCSIVSGAIGGLDDLESSLNKLTASLTSSLVTQVIDSCKNEAPTRRLLRDKIAGIEPCIYKSFVWMVCAGECEGSKKNHQRNEVDWDYARLVLLQHIPSWPLRENFKRSSSGLVPEELNVMIEMRSYSISPNSISYNILLSFLGRTRIKESCNILETMNNRQGETTLELLQRMKASALGVYCPVYDVLIPKFCRGGNLEKGRELWDEAVSMGVTLSCLSNLLDPSITEVFKPTRNEEKLHLTECANAKAEVKVRRRTGKTKQTKKKRKILRGMLKKKKKSAAT
ncbi:hypothetical protein ACFX2I_015558 [Malus domestica]